MNNQNDFRSAISLEEIQNGTYSWTPNRMWNQGPGVYGGLVFATIVEAIKSYSQFPIRRLNIDLCAPIKELSTTISVQRLRQGVNTHFLRIDFSQNTKTVAMASAVCGGVRTTELDQHHLERSLTKPTDPAIPFHPSMPSFSRFFEYWPRKGIPFEKASTLYADGWIRCRGDELLDQAKLSAMIDAWWPALYVALPTPRPMGTISCSIDFCHPVFPTHHPEPCWIENHCSEVRDGYSIEKNRLWSAQGLLLCQSQQLIAIIK